MADTECRFTITTGDKAADNELFVALQGIDGVRVEQDCYKSLGIGEVSAITVLSSAAVIMWRDTIAGIIAIVALRVGHNHIKFNGRLIPSNKAALVGAIDLECIHDNNPGHDNS